VSRYAKLARAAYYQAIDGRTHDREWLTLSADERLAWASVAWVLTNVAPGDESRDTEILAHAREALAEPQGAPLTHVEGNTQCLCPQCLTRRGEPWGAPLITPENRLPCSLCGGADHTAKCHRATTDR
jgi:hypothetical protein